MSLNKYILFASIAAAAPAALADVDVPAKVEQLKQNVESTRSNLSQYEENLKTVELNAKENDRALKALAKRREAMNREIAATAQGKGGVDAAKKQVEGYMKAETDKLAAEQKQIEALQKSLAQLEENKKRREANVAAYQAKLHETDGDAAAWADRTKAVSEADAALKQKELIAAADKKSIAEKRVRYASEIEAWKQKKRVSERQYANFSKLTEE